MVLETTGTNGLGKFLPRQASRGSNGACNANLNPTSSVAGTSRISPQEFRRERHHRGVQLNQARPLPLHASDDAAAIALSLANALFDF